MSAVPLVKQLAVPAGVSLTVHKAASGRIDMWLRLHDEKAVKLRRKRHPGQLESDACAAACPTMKDAAELGCLLQSAKPSSIDWYDSVKPKDRGSSGNESAAKVQYATPIQVSDQV